MINITAASEEDMPRIMEIERDSIFPPWTQGALLSEIYRDDSFFAVARHSSGGSDDIIGFVILRRAGDEAELFQIAVDKAARRGGAADMLMGAALSYASESRLSSVYLEVRKSNEAAVCLYKKHGFITVRNRKDYYTDPVEDAAVMLLEMLHGGSVSRMSLVI